MKKYTILIVLILATVSVGKTTINKPIHVRQGTTESESFRSVNGSITIAKESNIRGNCSTVNGSINIHESSVTGTLSTVNGALCIEKNCKIQGKVKSGNGAIKVKDGSILTGDISTINGSVNLTGTNAQDNIETINGSIYLSKGTILKGDIIIRDAKNNNQRDLDIVIDGSTIEGNIINKNDDMRVHVYLKSGGKVLGEIRNAQVND